MTPIKGILLSLCCKEWGCALLKRNMVHTLLACPPFCNDQFTQGLSYTLLIHEMALEPVSYVTH